MPTDHLLGSRTFTQKSQELFAALSRDHNPLHMDPLVARRTPVGVPVVHGVHTLAAALDLFGTGVNDRQPVRSVKASFLKYVLIGDTVEFSFSEATQGNRTIVGRVDGIKVIRVTLSWGPLSPCPSAPSFPEASPIPATPVTLDFPDTAGQAGRLAFPCTEAELAEAFPGACTIISPDRLRSLIATTTLVGMVCPGLHSLFDEVSGDFCAPGGIEDGLTYKVTATDPRFRSVRMDVFGNGFSGCVKAVVRMPPTGQIHMSAAAQLVSADAFAGSTGLVVGGSRGLGEVTAKILAAGGAKVVITCAAGTADAESVCREVRTWGEDCDWVQYDVRLPAAPQLESLGSAPTHLYYFATPPIFQRTADVFAPRLFAEFFHFYVTAFNDLFLTLRTKNPQLSAFYPSSVFVETRPHGMTEYAMAKAAGEILCADIDRQLRNSGIVVARLPRLLTDQTSGILQSGGSNAAEILLPFISTVQAFQS